MSDAPIAETTSATTDMSADEDKVQSCDDDAPVYVGSEDVTGASPTVISSCVFACWLP